MLFMQELQERIKRVAATSAAAEYGRIGTEMVNLHGEMVLLVNYSSVNYTGPRTHLFFSAIRAAASLELLSSQVSQRS